MSIIRMIKKSDSSSVAQILSRVHKTHDGVRETTEAIIADVQSRGFAALYDYTLRFDGAKVEVANFRVTQAEIDEAYNLVDDRVQAALKKAADNIRSFHQRQQVNSSLDTDEWGNITGQIVRPLERVGCYVPGGTAAYPSSVLMTAVPAAVAGVAEIVMVCPPDADGKIDATSLVAADLAGVHEIYKVGGAQAIAALTYGAGPLSRVDKIVGPGNAYVTMAKKICYGAIDIDMLAGPSEILVVADDSAKASYVAADLLSQAEHDPLSSAICLTDSEVLAKEVKEELTRQIIGLSREDIARASLADRGAIIVCDTIDEAITLANDFAPEHLELCIDRPFEKISAVKNAGALFLGHYTPEAVGDYYAGPNHVLPTSGTARFYSPLNLNTYQKKMSLIAYSAEGLKHCGADVVLLAQQEGLDAHAQSVSIRLQDGRGTSDRRK